MERAAKSVTVSTKQRKICGSERSKKSNKALSQGQPSGIGDQEDTEPSLGRHFQRQAKPYRSAASPPPASCKPTFKGVLSKYLRRAEAESVSGGNGTATAISPRSHMSSVMATPHRTSAACLSTD